jgi:hypothetical protein
MATPMSDSELLNALVQKLDEDVEAQKGLKHGLTELEGSYIDGHEAALQSLIDWISERRQRRN